MRKLLNTVRGLIDPNYIFKISYVDFIFETYSIELITNKNIWNFFKKKYKNLKFFALYLFLVKEIQHRSCVLHFQIISILFENNISFQRHENRLRIVIIIIIKKKNPRFSIHTPLKENKYTIINSQVSRNSYPMKLFFFQFLYIAKHAANKAVNTAEWHGKNVYEKPFWSL